MGTIEPVGVIRLLKNVPLDNTYTNSISWVAEADRTAENNQIYHFENDFTNYRFTKEQYQRVKEGVLRLNINDMLAPVTLAQIYDCNYMMFINQGITGYTETTPPTPIYTTNYPNKYFYAFINRIEYVNEQCVNIYYEIDVIQTWYFEWLNGLQKSFIIRTHSSTDAIGDNLVPENFDYGDLICMSSETTGWFSKENYAAVIAYSDKPSQAYPVYLQGGTVDANTAPRS